MKCLLATIFFATSWVNAYLIVGNGVRCRSGPGVNYAVDKVFNKGANVSIICQAPGTNINGDTLWDKISDGCYVSNFYVNIGSNKYVAPQCPGGDVGQSIVDAARKELGLPYVKGGGGCQGPSDGPPSGFDCSGLTQYAICQALNKKVPRTAQGQYDTGLGRRIPRSEAQAGDLLFWGNGGDCTRRVAHVGIVIREGLMINAATPGTFVREQTIWISDKGKTICPDAMRFR